MDKRKILYHIIFWAFIYFYIFADYLEEFKGTPDIYLESLILTSYNIFFYVVIFYINLLFLIPKLLKKLGVLAYTVGVVFVIILTFIVTLYSPVFDFLDISDTYFSDLGILKEIYFYLADILLFLLVSFLFWYFTQHKVEKERALRLQNEKLQAQLQFLKSQISPHFLFNSLNNIYSLIIQNHDSAALMVEKIADILRYIIYEGKKKKVSMQKEIALIENYIELQFLRKLKNRDSIRYTINGDFLDKEIVPLLLINIVENCFKHNNIESDPKGFLTIDVSEKDNVLTIHTQNTYTTKASKKKGIGLGNLKQQLKHHYPDNHSLNINDKNGLFSFELTLALN